MSRSERRDTIASGWLSLHNMAVSRNGARPWAASKPTVHADRAPRIKGACRESQQMISRRRFLNGTLGAGLALATSQPAAAQTPAAPGARKRMIVDAQVHLWKAESPDWPWVPGM